MQARIVILLSIIINITISAQIDSLTVSDPEPDVFDFYFETGTSISSYRQMGSVGSYFFSPGLKINATPKLSFNVKTIFNRPMYNSFSFVQTGEERFPIAQNQYVSLYAEGEYRFSEKIHVKASVYKNNNNLMYTTGYSPFSLFNFTGIQDMYSIGVYYDITKNLQIGAEFRQVKYTNPLYIRY